VETVDTEGTDDEVREGLLEDVVEDGGPEVVMFGWSWNDGIGGGGDERRRAGERPEMDELRGGKVYS